MTSFRIRPRFRFVSNSSSVQIRSEIQEKLITTHQRFSAHFVEGHVIVKLKKEEEHFWSPQLDMVFENRPEGGTLIRGLYGPNPNIWTLFVFLYGAVLLTMLFFAIYEGAQYNLGIIPFFSWTIPILICLEVLLYIVSQLGQKMGVEQTFALHHFLEDTLQNHVDIE